MSTHVLMAVEDMEASELAQALINKPLQSVPKELLRNLLDACEVEMVNRMADEVLAD